MDWQPSVVPIRPKGRRRFVERLDRRMVEEDLARCGYVPLSEQADARSSHLRRGWYWGSQAFAERLLQLGQSALRRERDRGYRASLEKKAHDTAQAEKLLREGLRAAKLDAGKCNTCRAPMHARWRSRESSGKQQRSRQSWLASQLRMGSAANVSQQLRRRATAGPPVNLLASLEEWTRSVKK